MAKILFMSDGACLKTGYGTVSREILTALHKAGHRIKQIGWGIGHNDQNPYPFEIIPCNMKRDQMGEDLLAETIREFKPDILFTLGDPWMFEFVPNLEERQAVFWINYFPIDGMPVPDEWKQVINDPDISITISSFGKKALEDYTDKEIKVIHHGVNTDVFKPLNKQEIKSQVIQSENKDIFIVGTVAKNQQRKNLPALMKAFAKFAEDKDDVLLYMHTQENSPTLKIGEMVRKLGIQDKTYYLKNLDFKNGISEQAMVDTYNLFDVFVLPSLAEGWGIPLLESQSCGVPILFTDYSSADDLVVDDFERLKVAAILSMGRNIDQAVVDETDITFKLEALYNDWKHNDSKFIQDLGQRGREKAETLTWDRINKEFVDLINSAEPKATKINKRIYPRFYAI